MNPKASFNDFETVS